MNLCGSAEMKAREVEQLVSTKSKLEGNITVGTKTIIASDVFMKAMAGPIVIGENNIFKGESHIIHRYHEDEKYRNIPLVIGSNNVFLEGCEIHAINIGSYNVFEPRCYVGPDVEIGDGCTVGAGCHVTGKVKIPDQTVVTGIPSIKCPDGLPQPTNDFERCQDEVTVIGEIFTEDEFSCYLDSTGYFTTFEAKYIDLQESLNISLSKNGAKTEDLVGYLPPIHLSSFLPHGYPSQCSPEFTVSCTWLGVHKLYLIAEELKKLWEDNKSEILYIWCCYLKEEVLETLKLQKAYELNDKYCVGFVSLKDKIESSKNAEKPKVFTTLSKYGEHNSRYSSNSSSMHIEKANTNNFSNIKRVEHNNLDLLKTYRETHLIDVYFSMVDFNASKYFEEFKKKEQECNVCFCFYLGELFVQLPCSHLTCGDCLRRMCEVHIQQGSVQDIVCPEEDCNLEIPVNIIKDLLTTDGFEKYDKIMLSKALDKLSNMIYCPLSHCQYPVTTQPDDSLAVCPQCKHAFCVYCRKTYHGVEPCNIRSDEKHELAKLYQNADHQKRVELEKRYGKKMLIDLVNTAKTEAWMTTNGKRCPCCNVFIEKSFGCNKMVCEKCRCNFCWICLKRLSSTRPYLHFADQKSPCYNLLYEGMIGEELYDDFGLVEEVQNGYEFVENEQNELYDIEEGHEVEDDILLLEQLQVEEPLQQL